MLYCAYGSNLHPERLNRRVGFARLLESMTVFGWELQFHKRGVDGSAKCSIQPADDASVVCVAIFEFEAAGLSKLDKVEGVGNGYRHLELEFPRYGKVLSYGAEASHIDDNLTPYEWYKEYVLVGCEYHGFDHAYVETIRRHPHCDDPNAGRHAKHMERVETWRATQR
jgi:hypothetical protein